MNNGAPLQGRAVVPSGSSQQAVSPVPASIPSAGLSDWADQELGALYQNLDRARDRLSGTARGCISDALKSIELADEYVAKEIRENAQ